MTLFAVLVAVAATGAAGLRWLRVAQREHYLPGSVTRFALRWWRLGANRLLAVAGILGVVLSARSPLAGVVGSLAIATGPFGLSVTGRTAPLTWTRRVRTLAAVWAGFHLVFVLLGWAMGVPVPAAVLGAVLAPAFADAALAATKPLEDRLAQPFVHQASIRLKQVRPVVVAITGSYGKTTTKGYVAHLLSGTKAVVPTPRSFNNRAGLARAVNEHLALGTEVFVAEMGTYGKGEIAELCGFVPPDIAVITAIGPVHLERMKTEENIVEAKAEILERAPVAVLNVEHPLLAALADRIAASADKTVIRCTAADVAALELPKGAHPTNVACAVAVARHLGVPDEAIAERVKTLPTAEHRLTVTAGSTGFTILDDTYNANPAGATAALATLARHARPGHKQVVVTPGMVELGPRQGEENRRFATAAALQASHLVVVGHTNRAALLQGARDGQAEVLVVETREDAVAWVRDTLQPGDVVLYENDLPDHFP